MRRSSVNQLELPIAAAPTDDLIVGEVVAAAAPNSTFGDLSASPGFLRPQFESGNKELDAATIRRAGRLNASQVTEAEYNDLLRERQHLLDKKFGSTMTRSDEIRLQYVRWSLDRIEDAKYGPDLDILEGAIDRYEQLSRDISNLGNQLSEELAKRRR
jgi:hypothetical protein